MTQETAITIFISSLSLLLLIVILAQIMFGSKLKIKAGLITNLIIVTPFLIAFILFVFQGYFGTYESTLVTLIAGVVITTLGILGYIVSMLYLWKNWSFSASIREGHKMVKTGPYRYIRHPIYFSLILVFAGSGLLVSNYVIILCTSIVGFVYYLRARKEEQLLKEEFPEYSKYINETKMLIPGLL